MTINEVLALSLAGCGLFAVGMYVEAWTHPKGERAPDPMLDDVDDEDLFAGWDWLSAATRRRRLELYQQRVRSRIAKQERAWLRELLREVAKG